MALARTNVKGRVGVVPNATSAVYGYGPSDLQSAYNLASAASSAGSGETVAVVDAYHDRYAASDLAVYRAQYGLPACDTSTGAGCVTVVGQNGPGSLPAPDRTGGWEVEESTDLDMVSAICPACHILLVEANSTSLVDLGTAENYAAANATFVSNSWGSSSGEFTGESAYDKYFDHPGVAVTFAAGDNGYGPQYPAVSQFVTSVGGTTLTHSPTARGWTETAWGGTGSGCAAYEAKPSWQFAVDGTSTSGLDPNGCPNRTENDVAAVADPNTPVAVYDTVTGTDYPSPGWKAVGGTSVAAPIIASVYALAGTPTANTYPSSYLYRAYQAKYRGLLYRAYQASYRNLYDVTSGSNGACETNRPYLCHGETGYDGPTGVGTPDGIGVFKNTVTTGIVTVTDPGTQDFVPGMHVDLQIQALDSASRGLTYSATGLPSGLSINASSGLISGTLANSSGTHPVQVTATDTGRVTGSVKFNIIVMP